MEIRRKERIVLNRIENDTYKLIKKDGETIYESEDNYFIYMSNVILKKDGTIRGSFLGYMDESSPLLMTYNKNAIYMNDIGYKIDGNIVRNARMIAVRNKEKTIVIVQND